MGILFCPPKYRTNGLDPVMWSSSRLAGYLRWIQQVAPSDAAAGFLWIGESVLEQARWFLHAGGVTTFLFKLDWSVWSVNPFWNKMVPAQVGGNYKFTWKTFLVFGSVAFQCFCGNRWVWMNLDIGKTTRIFCERTPFYWTSFLHVAEPALQRWEQEWVNCK